MKILTDIHCHTLASAHAYSTIKEITDIAAERGLEAVAMTDHASPDLGGLPDSSHMWHFHNLRAIPREVRGVRILRGVEADIIDSEGHLSMPEYVLKTLDIVIASLHDPAFKGTKGLDDYTGMYMSVLEDPYTDVIGHSGTPEYPYSHDDVLLKAKAEHKLIEINAATFRVRPASLTNCRDIALRCRELEVGITVDSDAHTCWAVGDYGPVIDMLREIDFPEKLIMNRNFETLRAYLSPRKNIGE